LDRYSDSATLYQACLSLDSQVQTAAYMALWQYLYRVVLHLVGDQPDGESLAQDCAQMALIRIHGRLGECREPAAFRAWSRRIASHLAIDILRQQRRLITLDDQDEGPAVYADERPTASPEKEVTAQNLQDDLYALIGRAPISDRSRRVVLGRYQDDAPDEMLARSESEAAGQAILPSHIQVTRAKDIARLRAWQPLQLWLESNEGSVTSY
jgi:RNA polymerase sigma factor (sigma-70 family)